MSCRSDYHHSNYPSFSSSLLEEIYRSFDDDGANSNKNRTKAHGLIMKKAKTDDADVIDRHRGGRGRGAASSSAVDLWIQSERRHLDRRMNHSSSSTSSSDSSSSAAAPSLSLSLSSSSSDADSLRAAAALRPVRTAERESSPAAAEKKGRLQRRAMKLYGDLKKVRQPISPGGRLAGFLNSLFASNGHKKPNHKPKDPRSDGRGQEREFSPASSSVPSTARSCLSKTPSSAGRFEKRSVRFVDVEEREKSKRHADRRPASLVDDEEFKAQVREKQRRVEEVAKELLKNYHQQKDLITLTSVNHHRHHDHNYRHHHGKKFDDGNNYNYSNKYNNNKYNVGDFEVEVEEEEDEDDEEGSCCSSDLFELENFLEIGVAAGRYREELPVYETTHVGTNRAIASGYIL